MTASSVGSIANEEVGPSWKCIADAWGTLSNRMKEDSGFAWSVHCNLACPFMDEGGSHEAANRAAARTMDLMFGVNVREFPEWKSFDQLWAAEAAHVVAEQ